MTFSKRRFEKITIKRVGEGSITTTDHTGFGVPSWVIPAIKVGDELTLELYKFNDIAGLIKENGEYLFHRTDEYFKSKLELYLADANKRREEWYEANKDDLQIRTEKLSPRYKARIERFLAESEEFRTEPMGWGYELIICELAMLYEKLGFGDGTWESEPEEIKAFASKYGTSGNQHDCAKMFAKNPDVEV